MSPQVTVVGNLSIDVVDGSSPTPGGCPSFVGPALAPLGDKARILTAAERIHLPFFLETLQATGVPFDVIESTTTSSFGLRYSGLGERTMTVEAIGPQWTAGELSEVRGFVHVSGLLRSDFPLAAIRALHRNGCWISFDGQGLVRVPRVGELRFDARFDREYLTHLSVLKLASEEADAIAGRVFDSGGARALGVQEVLVTHGEKGCDLYVNGDVVHVPAPWRVEGVQTTGAGDMFTTSYVVARAQGIDPLEAAHLSGRVVAVQLSARKVMTGP